MLPARLCPPEHDPGGRATRLRRTGTWPGPRDNQLSTIMVVAGRPGSVGDNGSVQGYRDDGVVLRTQKLGEADRIITLLTRHNGRVRAVARGIRRTKSRFGARLEPFTHVDVMIHPGRSLDVITQAEVIRAYGTPLVTDYPKYTAGTAMLETAERFTPVEKEPAIRQFLLLIGGLRALGDAVDPGPQADGDDPGEPRSPAGDGAPGNPGDPAGGGEPGNPGDPAGGGGPGNPGDPQGGGGPDPTRRDPRMVLDAYFLRSLTFAGYAPALEECARCGSPGTMSNAVGANGAKPLVAFAVQAGGMVCADCRPPGSASPASQTVALMVTLLRGDWDEAMRSERRHRVECSGLVAAYLQWHLEHSIRSLRHVERA
jgi:DNA repair protein RecO (recombination protein O)